MSSVAWRKLTDGENPFIIKRSCEGENAFRVVISDLVYVWVTISTVDEILNICKNLNPLIEFDDQAMVSKVWSLMDVFLENRSSAKHSSLVVDVNDDGGLYLKFSTSIDGIGFKFNLNLLKESPMVFFKEVTTSFVALAKELLLRQDLLCLSLEKKDNEIAQYKLEGASISRRNVETLPFIKEDFTSKLHSKDFVLDLPSNLLNVLGLVNVAPSSDSESVKEEQCPSVCENFSNPQPTYEQCRGAADDMKSTISIHGDEIKAEPQVDTLPSNKAFHPPQKEPSKITKPKRPRLNL